MSWLCGRILTQFSKLHEKKMEKVERKRKTDRDLYDVEVFEVDTTRKQLKIHFVGLRASSYDPVNQAGSVSEVSPRHSFLCKNIFIFS